MGHSKKIMQGLLFRLVTTLILAEVKIKLLLYLTEGVQ